MSGWVAGAIVVSSVVSAYESRKGRKAEDQARREAAEAQRASEERQLAALKEQYDALAPYRETGLAANEQLNRLLAGDRSQFMQDPGYQYRYEQGQKAVNRAASQQGFLNTPQQQLALQRAGQGEAAQEYDRYMNRLLVLSGRGQAIAGQGQAYGQNVANIYANTGQFQAQNALLAGQQRASTYQGYGNIFNNALNQYMQYRGYQQGNTGGGAAGRYRTSGGEYAQTYENDING